MGILIYWKFKSVILEDRHELEACLKKLGSLPTAKMKKKYGKAGETYLDLLPKKQIICSDTISRIFSRIVQEQAKGISLKLGMYFVKSEMLPNVKAIYTIVEFLRLPFEIFEIKIDPTSNMDAIQSAIQDDILHRIEVLKDDIHKKLLSNSVSAKILENKKIELNDLFESLELYKVELGPKHLIISKELQKFQEQIQSALDQAKNIFKYQIKTIF